MAAVRGRPSGLPVFSVPVRQPAHSCHPIVWRRLSEIGCDTVVLSDFSKLLAIPLRDGCDLMDVIGRRLQAAE
ncbi:hypothetical protein [Pseudomonas fluorescens]|uniref:hypothetical protein n=1 Tax=Pseudomonas fluorescens TaxID=294 RepID=UPI00124051F1|nr:hypothetical protein [Pseudomonas fluorescens]